MPGNTGDIDDRTATLLTHDWDDGLHRGEGAEEVGVEQIAAGVHVGLGNGVEEAVAGVVDPDIDPLEVMQRERENTIDFFGVADVAGKGDGTIENADAGASRFGASGIARKKNHRCAFLYKSFCDRFSDAH